MGAQGRKLVQETDAVVVRFAHSDDPAAAHGYACLPNMFERPESLIVVPRRNDVSIEFWRRIEIVVVGMQARIRKSLRLGFVEHAKRAADLQPYRGDASHHFEYRFEFGAVTDLAPCRTHTESRDTLAAGFTRRFQHMIDRQQVMTLHTCLIMRALRAIGAILRAAARFYGKQLAELHLLRLEILPVEGVRLEYKIQQACVVDGPDFLGRPIVSQCDSLHAGIINGPGIRRNLVR